MSDAPAPEQPTARGQSTRWLVVAAIAMLPLAAFAAVVLSRC
jgi:hypothetical protein